MDRWRVIAICDRPHPIAIGWRGGRQEYAPDAAVALEYIEIIRTPVDVAGTLTVTELSGG